MLYSLFALLASDLKIAEKLVATQLLLKGWQVQEKICSGVWNVCCFVCLPVYLSTQYATEQLLRTACSLLWSCLSTPWPLDPLAGTRLHTIPWKDAAVCSHYWGSQRTRVHCGEPPSCVEGTLVSFTLWVTAQNTSALRCAHRSQSLRLLVTQNLYTKDINLNHFPWVNNFNLESDSTDACKMALLDAIYFCTGEGNGDWSHKKNYKT